MKARGRGITRKTKMLVGDIKMDLAEVGRSGMIWLVQGQVESFCESGNELYDSLRLSETAEWLHNWWRVELCSAP
jgi:hypothetical protein